MISRKYKADELVGRKVVFERDLENRVGNGFSRGTVATIISAHYGVDVKTEPCPHCGQYGYIRKLSREDLSLLDSGEAK